VLRTARGELLNTDDIAGRVIAVKGFDPGDSILRAAIRDQVGSTVKRLYRRGEIEKDRAGTRDRLEAKALLISKHVMTHISYTFAS
jgi:hypothetical protein